MKVILSFLFVFVSYCSFSQGGMYIVAEKYDGVSNGNPTFDTLIVTNPSGVTTRYSIPHLMKNFPGHNSELNKRFNNIIQQGYRIVEANNLTGFVYNNTGIHVQTWFFVKP